MPRAFLLHHHISKGEDMEEDREEQIDVDSVEDGESFESLESELREEDGEDEEGEEMDSKETDVYRASNPRRTPVEVTDPPKFHPAQPSTRLTPESDKHSLSETGLRRSPNSAFVEIHPARRPGESPGSANGLFTPCDRTESVDGDEGDAAKNRKPRPQLVASFKPYDSCCSEDSDQDVLDQKTGETQEMFHQDNVPSPKRRRPEMPKTRCHTKGSIFRPFESPEKRSRSPTEVKQPAQVDFSRYTDTHLPITNYWLTMSRAAHQVPYPMPFAVSPLSSLQQTVDHYTQLGRSPIFPHVPLGFDTGVAPFRMHLMELQERQQRKEAELRLRAKRSPETSTVSSSTSFSSTSPEGRKTPDNARARTPRTPESEPRPLPDSSTVSNSSNHTPLDLTPSPAAKLSSPVFSSTPRGYPYEHLIPGHVSGASPIHPLGGVGLHPTYMSVGTRRPRDPSKPPPLKKYKCDLCGKSFSRSNTLVTHRRIHTGEKPFECEICSRAFRQPGNLTRHRLTHTTVKPYVCAVCSKAFNRASNLQTHMRTHTNFKPFVCPYCGKSFNQKVDLKIHCYTHTGEA